MSETNKGSEQTLTDSQKIDLILRQQEEINAQLEELIEKLSNLDIDWGSGMGIEYAD